MATINGGNGSDTITGTTSNDTINGGNGSDIIFGGDGNDTLSGGNGDDSLSGGSGNDTISGGNGDDYLDGGEGNDTLTGDNGNDILIGSQNSDTLSGNAGNDILVYKAQEDLGSVDNYDGNGGFDKIRLILTSAEKDYFDTYYKTDFLAWLANGSPGTFTFNGFSAASALAGTQLNLKSIESFEIIIQNPTSNTPPDAKNIIATINEDQSITFNLTGDNLATDADGNPLTITKLWTTTNTTGVGPGGTIAVSFVSGAKTFTGYATLSSDGQSFTFTATGNFDALQTSDVLAQGLFMYTVSDGQGGFDDAGVTMKVSGVNDAPIAANDSVDAPVDAASTSTILDPRSNDTDPENDSLSITSVFNVQHGTASIISSGPDAGKILFVAEKGYVGPASLQYTISDGNGGTSTATVTFNLQPMFHGLLATHYSSNASTTVTAPSSGSVNMIVAGLSISEDNTFSFAQALSPNPVSIELGIDSDHINEIYATLANGSLQGGEVNVVNLPNYNNSILWRGGVDQWMGTGSLTVNAGSGHNTLTLNNQSSPGHWIVASNAAALAFNFGTLSAPDSGSDIYYTIDVDGGVSTPSTPNVSILGGSVSLNNYSASGAEENYYFTLSLTNSNAVFANHSFSFTDLGLGSNNYVVNVTQSGGVTSILSGSIAMLRGNGNETVDNTFTLNNDGELTIGAPLTSGPSVTFTTGDGNSFATNNWTIGGSGPGHVTIHSGSFTLDVGHGVHTFTTNLNVLGSLLEHSEINVYGGTATFLIGDGNNVFNFNFVTSYSDFSLAGGSANIVIGDGWNTFNISLDADHSTTTISGGSLGVSIGGGNNTVSFVADISASSLVVSGGSATLSVGDGSNQVTTNVTISSNSTANISGGSLSASVGNGNNIVNNTLSVSGSQATISGGTFTGVVGYGSNTVTNQVTVDSSTLTVTGGTASLTVGDGNNSVDNTISISNSSANISNGSLTVAIGDGENDFTTELNVVNGDVTISGNPYLNASIGNGNNTASLLANISAGSSFTASGGHAILSVGDGWNTVTTDVTISDSSANISGGTLEASVGSGNNTVDNTLSISGSNATISGTAAFIGVVGGGDNTVTNVISVADSTLTVTGGSASLTVGDGDNNVDNTISISNSSANISSGSLTVAIGDGENDFTTELNVVNGDVTISGNPYLNASIGNGNNTASLLANISAGSSFTASGGHAILSVGDGWNTVTTDVTISDSSANISGGTLEASVGSGNNTVDNTLSISGSNATISGTAAFIGVVGGGDNTVTNVISVADSTLTVTGGSASLTVGDGDNNVDNTISITDSSADISDGSLTVVIGGGDNDFTSDLTVVNGDVTISGGELNASIGDGANTASLLANISGGSSLNVSGGHAILSVGDGWNNVTTNVTISNSSANISGGILETSVGDGNNTVVNQVSISGSTATISGGTFLGQVGNGDNSVTNTLSIVSSNLFVSGGSALLEIGTGNNSVSDTITVTDGYAEISDGSATITFNSGLGNTNTYSQTGVYTDSTLLVSGGDLVIEDVGEGSADISIDVTQSGGEVEITGGSAEISSASGLVTMHNKFTLNGGGTILIDDPDDGLTLVSGDGEGDYNAELNIGSAADGAGHVTINYGKLDATIGHGNNLWHATAKLIGTASEHSTITINDGLAIISIGDGNNEFTVNASSEYGDIKINGGTATLTLGNGANKFFNTISGKHSLLEITGGTLTFNLGNGNNEATNTISVTDGSHLHVTAGHATANVGSGDNKLTNFITVKDSSALITGGTLEAHVGGGDNELKNTISVENSSASISGATFVATVGGGNNSVINNVTVTSGSSLTVHSGSVDITVGGGTNSVTDTLNISGSTATIYDFDASLKINSLSGSLNTYTNTSVFTNNIVTIYDGSLLIQDLGAGSADVNLNVTQSGGSTSILGGIATISSASGNVSSDIVANLSNGGSIVIGTPLSGPTLNLFGGSGTGTYNNTVNIGTGLSDLGNNSVTVNRATLNATMYGNNTINNYFNIGNASTLSHNTLILSGIVALLYLNGGSNSLTNLINAWNSTINLHDNDVVLNIASNLTNSVSTTLNVTDSNVTLSNVNLEINNSGSGLVSFETSLNQDGGEVSISNVSFTLDAENVELSFPTLSFSGVENSLSGINITFGDSDDSIAISNLSISNGSVINIDGVSIDLGAGSDSVSAAVTISGGSQVDLDNLHISSEGSLFADLTLTLNGAGTLLSMGGINTIQGGAGDFNLNFTLNLNDATYINGHETFPGSQIYDEFSSIIGGTGQNTLNLVTNIMGGDAQSYGWVMDFSHSMTSTVNANIYDFINDHVLPFIDEHMDAFIHQCNSNILEFLANPSNFDLIVANNLGNLITVIREQLGGEAFSDGTLILGGDFSDHYIALDDIKAGTLTLQNELISLGDGNDTYFVPDIISGTASVYDKNFIIDMGEGLDIATYVLAVSGGTMRMHDSSLQAQDEVTINLPWRFSGDSGFNSQIDLRDVTWGNTTALTKMNLSQDWTTESDGTSINMFYVTGDAADNISSTVGDPDTVTFCKGYFVREFSVSGGVLTIIDNSPVIFGAEVINGSLLDFTGAEITARLDYASSTNPFNNRTADRNLTTVSDDKATTAASGLYVAAAGYHVVDATEGEDTFEYIQGTYTAQGGGGDDTVDFSQSAAGLHDFFMDTAVGGDNQVIGGDLTYYGTVAGTQTTVIGNATADNTFNVTAGTYSFIGGSGTDLVTYSTAGTGVTTSLGNGAIYTDVEDLEGTLFDDSLTGNMQNNTIIGLRGSDVMDGGSALLADIDTARYDDEAFAITVVQTGPVNYEVTRDEGSGPVTDYLSNIEVIVASPLSLADTIQGPDSNQSWTLAIDSADGKSTLSNPLIGAFKDFDILNGGTADDTLTIDLSNGNPVLSTGFAFHGGAGAFDTISITGPADSITYNYANANDGTIDILSGGNSGIVTYTGLDPILDDTSAGYREFNFATSGSTIALTDSGSHFVIDSSVSEITEFNESGTVFVRTGGNDLEIQSLNAGIDLYIQGGELDGFGGLIETGSVTVNGNLNLNYLDVFSRDIRVNADITVAGSLSLYSNEENATLSFGSGPIALSANDISFLTDVDAISTDLTLNGASQVSIGQTNGAVWNLQSLVASAPQLLLFVGIPGVGGDPDDLVTVSTSLSQDYYGDMTVINNGPPEDTTFISTNLGNITFHNNINTNGGVDGLEYGNLVFNTQGSTIFHGQIGNQGTTPGIFGDANWLNQITTDAGGTTQFDGGIVRTFQDQTYNDQVILNGDTTFIAYRNTGDISFLGGFLGGTNSLTVNAAGITTFLNTAAGSITTDALGSTVIDGIMQTDGGGVSSGDQYYGDAVVIAGSNAKFITNVGDVTFNSTLDGNYQAYFELFDGDVYFNGAVGSIDPIFNIYFQPTVNPNNQLYINGGTVISEDHQNFSYETILGADTLFISQDGYSGFTGLIANGFSMTVASATQYQLVMTSGDGDDFLYYDNLAGVLQPGFFNFYNAGAGNDTLLLDGIVDLTVPTNIYDSIENLDLTDGNVNPTVASLLSFSNSADEVTLSASDITQLNNVGNSITITGDADDSVHIVGGNTWVDDGISGGFHNYHATDVTASLSISTNITNVDFA